ncbi:Glycoside hydrolase family 76 [Neofusicoccum parvum]|nr:Glycoside hydrolase family 76 [Neofusicoccum parvum]
MGNLPDPYIWWHAGAMFMTMVDYRYYTGDNFHRAQRQRRDRRQLLARRHDAAHGVFLAGTAAMSSHTRAAVQRARTEQLLATAPARFSTPAATMVEPGGGRLWNSSVWDGAKGLCEQMAARVGGRGRDE